MDVSKSSPQDLQHHEEAETANWQSELAGTVGSVSLTVGGLEIFIGDAAWTGLKLYESPPQKLQQRTHQLSFILVK